MLYEHPIATKTAAHFISERGGAGLNFWDGSRGAQAAKQITQMEAGALLTGGAGFAGAVGLDCFFAEFLGALLAVLKTEMHGLSWGRWLPLRHPWVRRLCSHGAPRGGGGTSGEWRIRC